MCSVCMAGMVWAWSGHGLGRVWVGVLKGQILFNMDYVTLSNTQQNTTLAAHKLGLSINQQDLKKADQNKPKVA